jgi:hypothetical protein
MDLYLKPRFLKLLRILLAPCLSMGEIQRLVEYKLARNKEFTFNSHRLPYFFHSYNNFGTTERVIEIPIIRYYLEQGNYQNVLEIGNVTNHYYDYFREVFKKKIVVDKFELAYDVVKADICDYAPGFKFDFVFSISTFEHMDSDLGRNPSYVRDSSKLITVAADNIKYVSDTLIKDNGKFVITAPLGYTPEWDETFYSGVFAECGFTHCQRYLLRSLKELVWEQVDVQEGRGAHPTSYLPCREYLSVVEFDK